MGGSKQVLRDQLLLLTIFLIILPLVVTFNELGTRIVENFGWYRILQTTLIPLEIRIVKILVLPLGIDFTAYTNGMMVKGSFLELSWNCLGWQSIFMLFLTLVVGFRTRRYTRSSQIEVILIGILGTFLINLLRLAFLVVLFNYSLVMFAQVYHNYLNAFVAMAWLFFFWWFSYRFVLVEIDNTPQIP